MSRVEPVIPRSPGPATDRSPHRRRDSPRSLEPSPLDSVPIETLEREILGEHRVVSPAMPPVARAAYKMLRTRVLHRMRERNFSSFAVTSCAPGDGKTTTAVNLAISISEEINQRVVLVDLDLLRPSVHKFLGLMPKAGLSEYLAEKAALKDILLRPLPRLIVVPTITPMWNSSENVHSPRMQLFIENIQALDPSAIIIYDLPPLLASDDFLAFSPHVDGVLLVVAESKTPRAAVLEAREMIDTDKLLGVMLNRSDARMKPYYYY